jgi:hypothetical protein
MIAQAAREAKKRRFRSRERSWPASCNGDSALQKSMKLAESVTFLPQKGLKKGQKTGFAVTD